jgi:hypothetical protein
MTTTPSLDLSTLPDGVSATFTYTCEYGCTVRVVDAETQPHVCVGEQIIGAVAGDDVPWSVIQRIADSLKPLWNQRSHDVWVDGVRAGRTGELFYGVPEDVAAMEAEDAALERRPEADADQERPAGSGGLKIGDVCLTVRADAETNLRGLLRRTLRQLERVHS